MQVTLPLVSNAKRHGAQLAIVSKSHTLTWVELADLVGRFAAILRDMGISAGDRVAILAENCDLHLAAFFAIPWAGGILVEINLRLSAVEIADLIEHSGVTVVLHDPARTTLLADALSRTQERPLVVAFRGGLGCIDALIPAAVPMADVGRRGDEIASIFYTGGTTGRPKGAMLSHNNHMFNGLAMWAGLDAVRGELNYLHAPPMFHIADALFVHAVTLIGGTHVIVPRFDAAAVIEAVKAHEITDVYLVPTMIISLLDTLEAARESLPSLKRIYYGAAPMPEAVLRRLMRMLPDAGPIQLYGQTEAAPVVTMLLPKDHDLTGKTARLRSAGTPLPGTRVAILGADGSEQESGALGEIAVRSGAVMRGYWNDAEQTALTLAGGWLHTGDAGYIDSDGFLYVVDRIKDMIISGGENVYSIEVERAIALHPAVSQCAVIGVPDAVWGERVHAVVVLRPGAVLTHAQLREHCRQYVAGYKVPRSVEWRTTLPLSGPGKILKRTLRDEECARRRDGGHDGTHDQGADGA
jgi:acyl-CoA synthetase (AMP-forming)/AMP-acid ligase II